MSRQCRILALVLCALLVAALFASYVFLGVFAGHHCEDHHCEICLHTALLTRMLRGVLVLVVSAGAAGMLLRGRPDCACRCTGCQAALTPVTLGIRMND